MKRLLVLFLVIFAPCLTFSQIIYLSGTDKDHTKLWDFYCTDGQHSKVWTKIAVPSNWEQQGFGSYNYGSDKVKNNEQGLYKLKFTGPAITSNRVFLVFEGVMTDAEVKVNGQLAGPVHQGSFYRFKYDITALIKPAAQNLLEVTVSKTSANASVNHAERNGDFWIFGGIYRPVYLDIVPKQYIERVAIDAKADGTFKMDVFAHNVAAGNQILAQVQTLDGKPVGNPFYSKGNPSAEKQTLETKIDKPLLWSAEFPNRYKVNVSIVDPKTKLAQHSLTEKFGFRTVELRKNDGLYVNGAKILFKGVDRHSFWPESARTLSHDVHVMDVNLIKEMNMNAVRMSHYPPDADFINVCDSLGVYVLDELTGWHAAYDDTVGHKLVKEMVTRDVNHPAVLIWDNGNEGGWNVHLDNDYALYDPQNRTVIHPWAVLNGTNTKHYPDYAYLQKSVATEQDVFFPTEFMHALYDGGAGAGLDDFWNLMMVHPHSAGGFIWALVDEAVMRTDKNGAYDTDGNHAPDGIVGPHREKEGSFYAIKEIWAPVHIDTPVLDKTFTGKLNIANRYAFTNLNQCRFNWKLVILPSPKDKNTSALPMITGIPAPLNLAPGKSGILNLGLPATWQQADALYVTAYGPDNKEIFTWSWAIRAPAAITKSVGVTAKTKVTAEESGNTLTINCDGKKYLFDKATGYIQKVVKPGAEVSLSGGPVLAGVKTSLASFTNTTVGGAYLVEADYKGEGALHVKWTFTSGSPVKLDYTYSQSTVADFIGITFNYPEEKMTGMKWLGRGPYREWKNRLKGQRFGVWHKDYNTAVTGESWQYPEFTGYHGEVNWAVIENKESPFTVYTDDKNMYLQMLRPKREKDALGNNNVEPAFPDGNIGFLTAISPIGTKFQAAKVMGPQSQKNTSSATPVSGTLWFDFGK